MVKTNRRSTALKVILEDAGLRLRQSSGSPRMADLSAFAQAEVLRIHAMLGGLSAAPTLRPGSWDIETLDGLIIELDEEFHFTRYRAATLHLPLLHELPWADSHLEHCAAHEGVAARGGGKRWTSPAPEKMFGPSDPVGMFGERGSARGKQRALYDAMKDVAAATGAARLSRISIYDEVAGVPLGDVLYGKRTVPAEAVRTAIEARAVHNSRQFSS